MVSDVPARSPRWSPDGKWLAFLASSSAGDGKNQVWVIARDGTARRPVTRLPSGASSYSWSPDGAQLAVVVRQTPKARDFRLYSTPFYKTDASGWSDEGHNHIYIVSVNDGAARQLTKSGDRNDSDPQWSHDGKWIAYVSEQDEAELRDPFSNGSIEIVAAAGGVPRVVCQRLAHASLPRWSPDGARLAYAASPTSADQPLLWIVPVAGPGKPALAGDADLFPDEIDWDESGIWFGARDHGTAPLFRIDPATRHASKILGGERALHYLRISEPAHRLVYLENDDTHPPEVFTSDEHGNNQRQLTSHNRDLLGGMGIAPSERVAWKSADGLAIQGFLKRPVGWQAGRKYPLILTIHGGPNDMFGFHWEADEQFYAAAGYAVLMTNPRGSSGYGSKFQRAVAGEWGGKAYQDIMSGVETVLARYPWIDRNRLGVVGHSYGGFMTDWIVTQTNMFKAAISIAGISDFISVEGTRDAAYGHSRDFGGDLFQNFDEYWKYSPLRLAAKVKTPVLFLHGEADNRVPLSQSEEFFRAVKHFGGTAELAIFPREKHMLPLTSEPKHLVETYQLRLYWFDRWVKGDKQATPPGVL